jgi:hypothetical protein
VLLHRSKTTNVHETSSKLFINMCAAFRACCIKSARDNRTLRNSREMAAQKRIEERERERVCHRQQALSPLQQTGKEDDDSTFRNVPSGSILVVRNVPVLAGYIFSPVINMCNSWICINAYLDSVSIFIIGLVCNWQVCITFIILILLISR